MRLIRNVVVILLLTIVIIFAVTNMGDVTIEMDPFGLQVDALQPVTLPLAFVILGSTAIGLVIGVVMMRIAAMPVYAENRRRGRDIKKLEAENARLQESLRSSDLAETVPLLAAPRR